MSLLRIPTTAAGTVPLVQIQRDCSAAFKILDSAEMDTTVQVWEFFKVWLLSRFRKYNIHDLTFLSTKILRVLFLFFFFLPRALLDNPNYDLHFLFIYLFIFWTDKVVFTAIVALYVEASFFSSIGYDQLISLQASMNAVQVPTTAVWTTATSTNTKGSFNCTCSPRNSDLPAYNTIYLRITWDSRHWINRRDCVICTSTPTSIPLQPGYSLSWSWYVLSTPF